MVKEKKIGIVSNYFEHVNVAAVKLGGGLKVGDKIKIVGGDVEHEQKIDSMQIEHKKVSSAKKGDEIGIKIGVKAHKGYRVFKI